MTDLYRIIRSRDLEFRAWTIIMYGLFGYIITLEV